ncbi:MAG: DUF1350 family protein [Cyanobacteria bacterium P01_F01_bin.13]
MVLPLPSADRFKFLPCSHSWIALHPQPQGVIQFVGGALWGTFPTLAYRHFLKSLFEAGYTIVALPFRFALNHWSIALDLLDEHYAIRGAIVEAAISKGYEPTAYLDAANYAWVGHSLGCKYVVLLELLSSPCHLLASYFQKVEQDLEQWHQIQQGLVDLANSRRQMEKHIQHLTGQAIVHTQPAIMDEPSLLLAPAITDLNGAIPIKALQRAFSNLLKVYPTVEQTHQLIEHSQLFHLTGLLQFAHDPLAVDTCQRLMQAQPHIRRRLLKGHHLEPMGIKIGQFIMDFNPLDKFIQPLSCRDLEFKAVALLHRLRETSAPSPCRVSDDASSSNPFAA